MYVGVFRLRFEAFLRIFFGGVEEEAGMARRMRLKLRPAEVTSKRYRSIMVRELFADVLRATQRARLEVVSKHHGEEKLLSFPCFVDGEQRQMVAFRLEEFRSFLIGWTLLLFRTVENVLRGKHGDNGENFLGAPEIH